MKLIENKPSSSNDIRASKEHNSNWHCG